MATELTKLPEIQQQAIRWLVRLNGGQLDETETLAFADWLSQDFRHSQALAAAEDIFRDMTAVAGAPVGQILGSRRQSDLSQSEKRQWFRGRQRTSLFTAGLAASLALAALIASPGLAPRWLDDVISDYHTPVGEQREVTLSDGSRVLLNTDTALSVDFTSTTRHLTLRRGQARFTVAPDTQRPFEVRADGLLVQALGTIFDIHKNRQGTTQVYVEEHVVNAKADGPPGALKKVHEHEQLTYSPGLPLADPQAIDPERAEAWQHLRVEVNDQPLPELIGELERYRPGKIFLAGDALRQMKVTGVFPMDDPEHALTSIRNILKLRQTSLGPWWIVLHR